MRENFLTEAKVELRKFEAAFKYLFDKKYLRAAGKKLEDFHRAANLDPERADLYEFACKLEANYNALSVAIEENKELFIKLDNKRAVKDRDIKNFIDDKLKEADIYSELYDFLDDYTRKWLDNKFYDIYIDNDYYKIRAKEFLSKMADLCEENYNKLLAEEI